MTLIKDPMNIADSIQKHCENLREFKRRKLEPIENYTTSRDRGRRSIADLYSYDVEEIAKLVLRSIDYYINVDEMAKKTAQEKALADYMFWYNNDEEKRHELERKVYGE